MKDDKSNEEKLFNEESYEEKKTEVKNEEIKTDSEEPIKENPKPTQTETNESAKEATTEGNNETTAPQNSQTLFDVVEEKPNGQEKTNGQNTEQEIIPENETRQQRKKRKEGSGRKPYERDAYGNIIRPQKTEETTQQKPSNNNELETFLNQYKTDDKPTETTTPSGNINAPIKQQLDVSKFINGAVFLLVMDAIFPTLLLFLLEFMNPKYGRVKDSARKKLKLDKDERALLEEGANEIVKYVFADANPMVVFTISVGFIYYSKIDGLEDSDFLEPKRKLTDGK